MSAPSDPSEQRPAINPCLLHEKVTAGHTLSVTARYDNSEPWADVMGIYLTYVWWGTQ